MVAMATADLREIAKNDPSGFVVARGLDIHIAYNVFFAVRQGHIDRAILT